MDTTLSPAVAAPVLNGFKVGDSVYSYSYKPGGVDYYHNGAPVTREAFDGAFNSVYGAGDTSIKPSDLIAQNAPSIGTAASTSLSGAPTGGGTGTVDKSADITQNLAAADAAEQQRSGGLAKVDQSLASLLGDYGTEADKFEGDYSKQSDSNQNNLQRNKQTAEVNAAQGRQGLFSTLASLGALNGSGIDLANRAVAQGANEDLTGASDTFGNNQTVLDTNIGQFRSEDKQRRKNAGTAADNARTNVNNEADQTKQKAFSGLANDYAAENDSANANKFAGEAASLYPSLAASSLPDTLAHENAAYTPTTLANYLAGGNTTVSTTPAAAGGVTPGLVAGPKKKLQTA